MIAFSCPQCRMNLQRHETEAGTSTFCPKCNQQLLVPTLPRPTNLMGELQAQGLQPTPAALLSSPTKTSSLAITSLILGLVSICLPILAGLPALLLGLISFFSIQKSRGLLKGKGIAVAGILTSLLSTVVAITVGTFLMIGSVEKAKERAKQVESRTNLQQIGLAMHEYHEKNGRFPPAAHKGFSWRVALLPYLEQKTLYDQFHHDEPWNSVHNLKLFTKMPDVYRSPRFKADIGTTYYRGFTGPGTVLGTSGGLPLGEISKANGSEFTFLIVEASEAVPWTKPEEIDYDPEKLLPAFGGPSRTDFLALFCDGHVQIIPAKWKERDIRSMIEWNNTRPVVLPHDDLEEFYEKHIKHR